MGGSGVGGVIWSIMLNHMFNSSAGFGWAVRPATQHPNMLYVIRDTPYILIKGFQLCDNLPRDIFSILHGMQYHYWGRNNLNAGSHKLRSVLYSLEPPWLDIRDG
ncbi:hypothetical protein D9758_014902 [Tetrapyrgos nigripes]|uniref:Uncharacterized protein n=1 Tax=Tetrapyrgos nigripes TaxID=182062 RepID=A0A8H5CDG4_9AGAR|nr:hypothetical protein D9758_014902 [Tetrapyrgos nigripes]